MPQINQTSSVTGGTITERITSLEQQWASAAKAGEAARVAPLLADVFAEMDSDGTVRNKSQVLERMKGEKWQVFEISDIKVAVHGNVAIATGSWRGQGTSADGKPIDAHERWMDTWHQNGKWQCLASASAPAKM